MGLYNDDIEKVQVNNGYAITLFENDNFQGSYQTYLGDESSLTKTEITYASWDVLQRYPRETVSDFSNQTSSIRVQCIESLSINQIAAKSSFNLNAKKADDKAELTISHSLTKEAISVNVEKYYGQLGDFLAIEDIIVSELSSSYTIIDPELKNGDNVYLSLIHISEPTRPY